MEYSNYMIAAELQTEIRALKKNLNDLDRGIFSSGIRMILSTNYTNGDFTAEVNIDGEVCTEIGKAVKDAIRNRIAALEKEFMEL